MGNTTVYIALGSNLGDRRANLVEAISRLQTHVAVEKVSSVYETEPAYVADQPRFLNMVLQGSTALSPRELLSFLKKIEQHMGRTPAVRYGPRLIDLDILAYGDLQLEELDLTIPHPKITERAFVLKPLAEITPDLVLPGQQACVAALAQKVGTQGDIVRVERPLVLRVNEDNDDE
jgi:2-amino-4-hydroxy-6-hydroxymethyldihydropteridine diphosphokinase